MRALRSKLGLSQDEISKQSGVPLSSYKKYELDTSVPGGEALAALGAVGIDLHALLIPREGTHARASTPSVQPLVVEAGDFVMVPRYDVHGSAGKGELIHSEQIVDHLAFRAEWVRNALGVAQKDLALISVKGDSMEPTLSNGDLILVDTGARHVEDSAIYVLTTDKGLFVKRLQHKLSGEVVVKSDNVEKYEPEFYDAEAAAQLSIVGRVVWAGRRL